MNAKFSLIVPVYNESDEIDNFFDELKHCNLDLITEVILINDCSTDGSLLLIKKNINNFNQSLINLKFKLLNNSKNKGYGFSIKKGVKNSNNENIAIIDLDRTYKIRDLNEIAEEFINNDDIKYDLIVGQREININNTSRLKIVGKTIINAIANFCFNEKIIDYNSGLRVFRKDIFMRHSNMMSDRFSLTTSMTITFFK
jgi:glycosyltransferase involved in cell wall biosynthesis